MLDADSLVLRITPAPGRVVLVEPVRGETLAEREVGAGELERVVANLAREGGKRIERVELNCAAQEPGEAVAVETAGAVLIGFAPRVAGQIRAGVRLVVDGQIDVSGNEIRPLDEARLRAELSETDGPGAWAVSGVNSTLNPAHEQQAAELIRQVTGRPVLEGRYFRDAGSAIDRATAALAASGWLMAACESAGSIRRGLDAAGLSHLIHVVPPDALASALMPAGAGELLRGCGAVLDSAELRAEARITRASRDAYACHCSDGRYEFESLVAAKAFADRHLRDLLLEQARRAGLENIAVQVELQDRFGRGQGRKGPMRVYLETAVAAWAEHKE